MFQTQYSAQYFNTIRTYLIFFTYSVSFVSLMVFKATFNNISVILWRSVLLVVETGGPGGRGEDHRPVASHRQIFIT